MYSCSEVTKWIASGEYQNASVFRKLGIHLHLLKCEHCSRYQHQLEALAGALRKLSRDISPSEVGAAKERVIDQLARKS